MAIILESGRSSFTCLLRVIGSCMCTKSGRIMLFVRHRQSSVVGEEGIGGFDWWRRGRVVLGDRRLVIRILTSRGRGARCLGIVVLILGHGGFRGSGD
jgi:hypothetical protein